MYLEISHRQSGKTTRLINQIYRDKSNYDIQILMGMNYKSLKMIKDQIKGNAKVKICLSYESLNELLICNYSSKRIRLYVDEFMYSTAFCNNFKIIQSNYGLLLSNGYFSSSINSNHVLLLLDLQQLNNSNCVTVNVINKFWL